MWMDSSGTPGGWVSSSSKDSHSSVDGSLTFSFRNAHDGVHDHDDASAAEDQERAECDLGQHDGCQLRDDEVEQPLSHQRCRHGEGANVVGLYAVSIRCC